LIEIVSEPDMRSSGKLRLPHRDQAGDAVPERFDLRYGEGHLRCDANVSVRLRGAEKLGTKAEVKNLNSFKF